MAQFNRPSVHLEQKVKVHPLIQQAEYTPGATDSSPRHVCEFSIFSRGFLGSQLRAAEIN